MKDVSSTVIAFRMEAKRFFGNRKIVLSAVVLPIVMMFFIIFGISELEKNENGFEIHIYSSSDIVKIIQQSELTKIPNLVFSDKTETFETDISSNRNCIGILVDTSIKIGYDSATLTEQEALFAAQHLAMQISVLLSEQGVFTEYIANEPSFAKIDVCQASDKLIKMITPLLMMISIISVMLVCANIVSLSSDSISGERERGTLDMLRLSGVKLMSVILGKTLFLVFLSWSIMILESIAALIGMLIFNPSIFEQLKNCSINIVGITCSLLLIFLEISLICSACFVCISSFFGKVRQATTYSSFGMIVLSLATSISAFSSSRIIAFIPIANLPSIIQKTLGNEELLLPIVFSFLISGGIFIVLNNISTMKIEEVNEI